MGADSLHSLGDSELSGKCGLYFHASMTALFNGRACKQCFFANSKKIKGVRLEENNHEYAKYSLVIIKVTAYNMSIDEILVVRLSLFSHYHYVA